MNTYVHNHALITYPHIWKNLYIVKSWEIKIFTDFVERNLRIRAAVVTRFLVSDKECIKFSKGFFTYLMTSLSSHQTKH